MLKKFLGVCIFKIKGLNSERFINNCLKNKIEILQIEKNNEYMLFKCYHYQIKQVLKILKNYEILSTEYKGLNNIFNFFKNRIAFIVGFAFAFVLVFLWQTHLCQYKITGLETISENEIIKVLSQNGYKIGCNLNKIETTKISNILLSSFPNLAFASIIQAGPSLVINLKEKEYDENLDESLIVPIVAGFDGVINEINTYQGTPLVSSGDIVRKGQVLIAPYVQVNGEIIKVRARGEVNASIFLKGQVIFNENATEMIRSGNYVVQKQMELLGSVFPMMSARLTFTNYEIEKSCKIICKNMPICFKIIETRYYELIEEPIKRTFEEEKEILIKKSRYLAYENLISNFNVIEEQTDIVKAGENYYITTYLKANTNIGVTSYESDI